jgi:hypothetical protein
MRNRMHRRAFLGGASVTIGLPFLEAMLPRGRNVAKAQADAPRRLVFVAVPYGMIRTGMTPGAPGPITTAPRLFSGVQDIDSLLPEFSILTGIHNNVVAPKYMQNDDGGGAHARGEASFLTGARIRKPREGQPVVIENGISVDQEAAKYLTANAPTLLPSLELTTAGGSPGDTGYPGIYRSSISWTAQHTPVPPLESPAAAFERLFPGLGVVETEMARQQRVADESSILDAVVDDVASLRVKLGSRDWTKLDKYLEGIRSLESRLEPQDACAFGLDAPLVAPLSLEERAMQMYEVISLAFACDRTRVVTLSLRNRFNYDFLSVDGEPIIADTHSLTHFASLTPTEVQYYVKRVEAINRWQLESFCSLLRILDATQADENGESLLHNSLVLFGCGLDGTSAAKNGDPLAPSASGDPHGYKSLPLLLAGRGGGDVQPGRHIVYPGAGEPISNLFISMLHNVGHTTVQAFGSEGTDTIGQLAG